MCPRALAFLGGEGLGRFFFGSCVWLAGRIGLLQLATLDWAGMDLQAHVGSAVRSLSFERSRFLFSGGCLPAFFFGFFLVRGFRVSGCVMRPLGMLQPKRECS